MSYIRPVPNTWWLQRRPYFLFIVREFTAVAAGGYAAVLLYLLYRLSQGPEEYAAALSMVMSPVGIALQFVALLLLIYHSVTWFNVTPKVLVFRIGEERVPPVVVAGAHYAAWIAVSALVAWVVLGM